jgi:hypothetical protein
MDWMLEIISKRAIECITEDLHIIAFWLEKRYTNIDKIRDSEVINSISRIDKACDSLLALGIDPEKVIKDFHKIIKKIPPIP